MELHFQSSGHKAFEEAKHVIRPWVEDFLKARRRHYSNPVRHLGQREIPYIDLFAFARSWIPPYVERYRTGLACEYQRGRVVGSVQLWSRPDQRGRKGCNRLSKMRENTFRSTVTQPSRCSSVERVPLCDRVLLRILWLE